MGDSRFSTAYDKAATAHDRVASLRALGDEQVVEALAAASRASDPLLANVLATEALNRIERVRAALAHMTEGVAALSVDGTVRWINPAGERLLGIKRTDAVDKSFHTLVDHRDSEGHLIPHEECKFLSVSRSGRPVEADGEYFVRGDRSRVCVSYTSAPTRDADGGVGGIVVVFRDCSAKLARDEEQHEVSVLYRALLDALPQSLVTLDARGTILDSNAAATAVTGRTRAEARGHSFLALVAQEHVPRAAALFQGIVSGQAREGRFNVLRPDGSATEVQARAYPIMDGLRLIGVHCLLGLITSADPMSPAGEATSP